MFRPARAALCDVDRRCATSGTTARGTCRDRAPSPFGEARAGYPTSRAASSAELPSLRATQGDSLTDAVRARVRVRAGRPTARAVASGVRSSAASRHEREMHARTRQWKSTRRRSASADCWHLRMQQRFRPLFGPSPISLHPRGYVSSRADHREGEYLPSAEHREGEYLPNPGAPRAMTFRLEHREGDNLRNA